MLGECWQPDSDFFSYLLSLKPDWLETRLQRLNQSAAGKARIQGPAFSPMNKCPSADQEDIMPVNVNVNVNHIQSIARSASNTPLGIEREQGNKGAVTGIVQQASTSFKGKVLQFLA